MNNLKKLVLLFSIFFSVVLKAELITGATKGNFSVNQGSASYNLEIVTPKGIAGLKPSLSINYNSMSNANGLLGVGFSLGGLSQISLCPEGLGKDDPSRDFDYCLDGQKLVTKNPLATYGDNDIEYKTEIDSYSKIEKESNGWKAYTKDGLIYYYGKTADSKDLDVSYRVNKIKDRYDNEILFSYDTLTKAPTQIEYANNIITFEYENREDSVLLYFAGIKIDTSKRLKSISIKTNNSLVSKYNLNYIYKDNKSRVENIQECADEQSCLEPVYFNWEDVDEYTKLEVTENYRPTSTYSIASNNYNYKVGDYNGDGKMDLLHLVNGTYIHIWLSNGDGTFTITAPFKPWDGYALNSNQYNFKVGDFNGDGKSDVIHLYENRKSYIWLSNGDGTFKIDRDGYLPWSGYDQANNNYNIHVGDFNGDGKSDLIQFVSISGIGYALVWISKGDGTFYVKGEKFLPWDGYNVGANGYNYRIGDFNGDGKSDLVHLSGTQSLYIWISKGDGTFDVKSGYPSNSSYHLSSNSYNFDTGDFNGDGKTDLVHFTQHGYLHLWFAKGDGSFDVTDTFPNSTEVPAGYDFSSNNYTYQVGDFNGDGMSDLAHINAHDHINIWTSKGQGSFKIESVFSDNNYDTALNHYNFILSDFNGNGLTDILHLAANDKVNTWATSNINKVSKVINISNFKDQDIDIEYSTLRDSSIYTSTKESTYPTITIKEASAKVVKSYSVNNGIGGEAKTSFKYRNFSIDKIRGGLGFEEIETLNETTNTVTKVTYNQNFPFIGTVKSTNTMVNNRIISQTDYIYTNIPTAEHYYQPQLSSSVEQTYDYETYHLLNKKEVYNYNFDEYGNVGNIVNTTTGDGNTYIKRVENIYTNDDSNWILARLTSSKVTHQKTATPTIIKESEFAYNSYGTLEKEIIEPNESSKKIVKTYVYDNKGNKTSETVAAGNISRSTNFSYDTYGINQTKVTNALGHSSTTLYNNKNQVIKVTGINGLVTSFEYDKMGRKIKQTNPDDTYTTWTHLWDETVPNSLYVVREKTNFFPETLTYFDRLARKVRIVKTGFSGKKIFQDIEYNDIGKVAKESTPYFEGETPQYVYTRYDDMGRIVELEKPAINGQDVIYTTKYKRFEVIKTDPKGVEKIEKYNSLGKRIRVQDAFSAIEYEYDSIGNLIKTTDSQNNSIVMTYDILGNKTSMNDPDMGFWTYTYDAFGQLKSQTDAKGQVTTFYYDSLGRKTKRIQSGNSELGKKTSTWIYSNSEGTKGKLLAEYTDDISKAYNYDNLGRLIKVTTTIDNETFEKVIEYDDYGRVDYTIEPGFTKIINSYNKYGYKYGVKTPKPTIVYNGSDSFESTIETLIQAEATAYQNYLDIKIAIANKENKLNSYRATYDGAEYNDLINTIEIAIAQYKVLRDEYQAESDTAKERLEFLFNYRMNISSPYFVEYTTTKDLLAARVSTFRILAEELTQEIAMNTTNKGDVTKLLTELDILNTKLNEEYEKYKESIGELEEALESKFEISDAKFNYFYKVLEKDAFGRDIRSVSGNGIITEETYEINGMLAYTKSGTSSDPDKIRNLAYEYDASNNVSERDDKILGLVVSYTYDAADRIQSANASSNATTFHEDRSYFYDAIGNFTGVTGVGIYNFNSSRPHAVTSITQNGIVKSFQYDENGNMTKNHNTTIKYSHSNKPISFSKAGVTTSFKYDMNDQRYKKQISSGKTVLYLGKTYEKIKNSATNIDDKYYIYANGRVAAMYTKPQTHSFNFSRTQYLHYDNLGSVDAITNNLGNVEQRMAYRPFGDRYALDKDGKPIDKAPMTTRGYTGHEHLEEFDFIHMNGRVYDPTIGRFLSADPHIQDPYDSQSYNRYTYVKNNPLKYTDPSGFFFKKLFKKIKKWIKPIVAIAVAAIVAVYAPYLLGFTKAATFSALANAGFGAAVVSGAAAGFASGAILTGSMSGALKGAAFGAISAGAVWQIGHGGGIFESIRDAGGKHVMHGIARAAITKAQGGRWSSGFWSAFASSLLSPIAGKFESFNARTVVSGIIGGTVSEISGGKFANGAVSGAFTYMFNHALEEIKDTGILGISGNFTRLAGKEYSFGVYWNKESAGIYYSIAGTLGYDDGLDIVYGELYGNEQLLDGQFYSHVGSIFMGGKGYIYNSNFKLTGKFWSGSISTIPVAGHGSFGIGGHSKILGNFKNVKIPSLLP